MLAPYNNDVRTRRRVNEALDAADLGYDGDCDRNALLALPIERRDRSKREQQEFRHRFQHPGRVL